MDMAFQRRTVLVCLVALGAISVFGATANAATAGGWDVPDYTSLSVKATSPSIGTEAALREAIETSFAVLDTNHDGKISLAELQAAYSGVTPALFALVDTNGDGFITAAEAAAGAGCAGFDLSDPGTIIVAILAFFGLVVGWACSGC